MSATLMGILTLFFAASLSRYNAHHQKCVIGLSDRARVNFFAPTLRTFTFYFRARAICFVWDLVQYFFLLLFTYISCLPAWRCMRRWCVRWTSLWSSPAVKRYCACAKTKNKKQKNHYSIGLKGVDTFSWERHKGENTPIEWWLCMYMCALARVCARFCVCAHASTCTRLRVRGEWLCGCVHVFLFCFSLYLYFTFYFLLITCYLVPLGVSLA